MESTKKVAKTIRMSAEFSDKLDKTFEESGFDSKGEYLESIFDKVNNEETTVEIEEVKVEVEKKLEPNQLLISFAPSQFYALYEHVSRDPEFATKQNAIIDKLASKPWWASSDVYKPEFQELWVRNIELTDDMIDSEKEEAIKFNMSAFLLNMFLTHLLNGDIPNSEVNSEDILSYILDQSKTEKTIKDELPDNQK